MSLTANYVDVVIRNAKGVNDLPKVTCMESVVLGSQQAQQSALGDWKGTYHRFAYRGKPVHLTAGDISRNIAIDRAIVYGMAVGVLDPNKSLGEELTRIINAAGNKGRNGKGKKQP